jgi:hypothetical protein
MAAPSPISLEALSDPAERPGLIAAAEQLSECLSAASGGQAWPVRLNFLAPGAEVAASPAPTAIITSLLAETLRPDEPIDQTKARWRGHLEQLLATGAPVFVCTVFRHVRARAADGSVTPVLERIRRLNLMAAELSHELGVAVIDIDRAFAHIGGRILQTDYRLPGVLAAEVAGQTTVWSLLSFGLDEVIDPDLQEKAKAVLGDLSQINVLVSRRLSRRQAARG